MSVTNNRSDLRILEHLSRVIGPPGCGKTTYLSRQVRTAYEAGHDVMVCSLTRAAAVEVSGRDLPIDSRGVGTLHAHSLHSLEGGYSGIADTPKLIAEWNRDYPNLTLSGAEYDLDEDNASPYEGKQSGDATFNALNRLRARMVPRENWPAVVQSFHANWTRWKKDNDLIDFTDMLEIALDAVPIAPGNPNVIFADEAQDFSRLEMALLHKWGVKAGRLVVVGDPNQALYEWRGSEAAVFFEGEIPPDNYRVLGQSFRVPRAVHGAAMGWLSRMPGYRPIEYKPTEVEGHYSHLDVSLKQPERLMPVIEDSLAGGKDVMLLTSCTYMLRPVIDLLRSEGIPFHNPYRRKNGAWNPLLRRGNSLTASDRLAAFLRLGEEGYWTRDDLLTWLPGMKCSEFLPGKKGFSKIKAGLESWQNGEMPYWLAEATVGEAACEASMAGDCRWYARQVTAAKARGAEFPCAIAERSGVEGLKSEPKVILGTIHSVKGGEADTVIVAPDLSLQGVESWNSSVEGQAAIFRLFYVAMTRAKETLHILQPSSPQTAVPL